MKNTKLVWSDDPKDKQKLLEAANEEQGKQGEQGKRGKGSPAASDTNGLKSNNFVAVFRIEKSGRGGKTVTVIDQLPKVETFLKDLTKELKSKCGVGGTYLMDGKEGVIEIQGDKRDEIKAVFAKKGFKFKGM